MHIMMVKMHTHDDGYSEAHVIRWAHAMIVQLLVCDDDLASRM